MHIGLNVTNRNGGPLVSTLPIKPSRVHRLALSLPGNLPSTLRAHLKIARIEASPSRKRTVLAACSAEAELCTPHGCAEELLRSDCASDLLADSIGASVALDLSS